MRGKIVKDNIIECDPQEHNFQPRYEESPVFTNKFLGKPGKRTQHVSDVCSKCGKIIQRND